MNAYFLSGEIIRVITGDSSLVCVIGYGADEAAAIEWYGKWLEGGYMDGSGANAIANIRATPIYSQLITETGPVPLDWPALMKSQELPEGAMPDDFDAGYWLNANALVPSENLASDLDTFRNSVPTADAAELNWNPAKNHLFAIKAFQEKLELIILAQTRNALTAAWSWRHHGWETAVSRHSLVVEPCCQIVSTCA